MVQLTLNGLDFPETSGDKYKCYPKDIGTTLTMASGRLVFEKRGEKTIVEYAYDFPDGIEDGLMRQMLEILRSKQPIDGTVLSDDGELRTEMFLCTQLAPPSYAFSIGVIPYWHGISFKLEGVNPRA